MMRATVCQGLAASGHSLSARSMGLPGLGEGERVAHRMHFVNNKAVEPFRGSGDIHADGMDTATKLGILADAAKYDASCASSGTNKRNSREGGIGSTTGSGICHSYTPDGRCVSLLKILLTNFCVYDCQYCINRVSSDTLRARFTPDEVVNLTLDFYRRNYIEGLFLSSGIIRNPDYTMEQVVKVARTLRETHGFRGYIHLKTIPEASPELIAQAGRWADRISINVELPTVYDLEKLAPEKNLGRIRTMMGTIRERITQAKAERRESPKAPPFAPAGQSTQMIVGATPTADRQILEQASSLYGEHKLRRVYYSAFSPIPDASRSLPWSRRPSCGSTASTRRTGCSASTVFRWRN